MAKLCTSLGVQSRACRISAVCSMTILATEASNEENDEPSLHVPRSNIGAAGLVPLLQKLNARILFRDYSLTKEKVGKLNNQKNRLDEAVPMNPVPSFLNICKKSRCRKSEKRKQAGCTNTSADDLAVPRGAAMWYGAWFALQMQCIETVWARPVCWPRGIWAAPCHGLEATVPAAPRACSCLDFHFGDLPFVALVLACT